MTTTEERLADVERRLARSRAGMWCLALCLAVGAGVGADLARKVRAVTRPRSDEIADVLRARNFEVVNESGTTVVRMNRGTDGSGGIRVFSALGEPRVSVSGMTDGGVLLVQADPAAHGLLLRASGEGGEVRIEGSGGIARLSADSEFRSLSLSTAENMTTLMTASGDGGHVQVNDSSGKAGVSFSADANGALGFAKNKTGEVVVGVGADEYGVGFVQACDRKAKYRSLSPAQ